MGKIINRYETRFRVVRFLVLAGLTLLAWFNRFIQDDAFISFRYAYNFAHGKGLVWNDGERVEGYTNFLWTIIMSAPIGLGLDPVSFSIGLGLTLFIITLHFTYKLSLDLMASSAYALLTVALLGTNYTFSSYATGGLETQLQACLFITCTYLLMRLVQTNDWSAGRLLTLSLLLGLAMLTRLDSALLLIIVLPVMLFFLLRRDVGAQRKMTELLLLAAPLIVLVGGWLAWKIQYYGDVFPNTYYAKASPPPPVDRGLTYLYLFFYSYRLFPFFFLFLLAWRKLFTRTHRKIFILIAIISLWLLYTVRVGGDFMEFRFLVPVLPLIFILITWLIFIQIRRMLKLQIALIMLILAGSLHHALTYSMAHEVESIRALDGHVKGDGDDWEGIGKFLGQAFDHDPDLMIATSAAGAIPYYSRLKTVDMFGLNDEWIAKNGQVIGPRPGHQKYATLDYLIRRQINLVLGQPQLHAHDFPASIFTDTRRELPNFVYTISDQDRLPTNARIIEIPINQRRKLFVLYLTANPRVDLAIEKNGWRTYLIGVPNQDGRGRAQSYPHYAAGTRIDFTTAEADRYLWYGWSVPEPSFRWSEGHRAAIIFALDQTGAGVLRLKLSPFLAPQEVEAQRVKIELNGQLIATLQLKVPKLQEYSIALPENVLGNKNVLSFELPDANSPSALGVGVDGRLLGINVEWMEVVL